MLAACFDLRLYKIMKLDAVGTIEVQTKIKTVHKQPLIHGVHDSAQRMMSVHK
jgi:hypothetical protein